jgi:hypothetical protein
MLMNRKAVPRPTGGEQGLPQTRLAISSGNPVVFKDSARMVLPPHTRKTILEGRMVKDGVCKALKDRHIALTDLPSYRSGIPALNLPSTH